MKYSHRHARRCLARVLALVMLTPYLGGWGSPARAQAGPLSIYVLDFNNKTTVGGALLGQVAAAQVALQMAESPNWDVIPQAQVLARMQALNLKPPFDRAARVTVATGVDAVAIVYGSITEARVSGQPTPQAFVRVQVVVEDVTTGELINGSIAEGLSTPRMGFAGDADVLLEEALGKAAFRAREFMDIFKLPHGTVLNTTVVGGGDNVQLDALLNIGVRQGVKRGMTMIVTRQKEPVGKLKVISVDDNVSTGRVTQNTQGVRPEDRVRGIFNFEDFPTRSIRRGAAPAGPLPVAALPVGGKTAEAPNRPLRVARAERGASFVPFQARDGGGALAQSTVQPPPPVVVDEPPTVSEGEGGGGKGPVKKLLGGGAFRMMMGGLLVLGILAIGGRGGANASRVSTMEAFGWQTSIGAPGAYVQLRWERPRSVRSSQVLQYTIFRDGQVDPQQVLIDGVTTDSHRQYIDREHAALMITNIYTDAPGSVGDTQGTITSTGIVSGLQYRYSISTVYQNGLEDRDGDGTPDVDVFHSPLSNTTSWVTAITPPSITDPIQGEQVDLNSLEVTWQQTPGSDTYMIWLSSDPAFHRKRVAFGPFRTVPVDQGGDPRVTQTVNANVRALAGSSRVYVSVGARSSNDREIPRPFGAIFGAPVAVRPETVPPPPPGGSSTKPGRGGKKK